MRRKMGAREALPPGSTLPPGGYCGHEVIEEAGSDPRARQEPLLSHGCDAVSAQPGRGMCDGKGVCAGGAVPNLALG